MQRACDYAQLQKRISEHFDVNGERWQEHLANAREEQTVKDRVLAEADNDSQSDAGEPE